MPKKAVGYEWDDAKIAKLIDVVSSQPPIYDPGNECHSNPHESWTIVGERMQEIDKQITGFHCFSVKDILVKDCKLKWKSLRDYYSSEHKQASGSGAKPAWKFDEDMSFLSDYKTDRCALESGSLLISTERLTNVSELPKKKDSATTDDDSILIEDNHVEKHPHAVDDDELAFRSRSASSASSHKRSFPFLVRICDSSGSRQESATEKLLSHFEKRHEARQ